MFYSNVYRQYFRMDGLVNNLRDSYHELIKQNNYEFQQFYN